MEEIPLRPDGLQLDEDRRFQEQSWTVERAAWAVFGLVVLAALAGLTGGGGPLSSGVRDLGDARVEYPAITRWTASDVVKVTLPQSGTPGVTLGPDFLDAFAIESIKPEPVRSTTTAQGLRLEFQVEGEGAAPVSLVVQALAVGRVRYDVTVEGAGSARLTTLILP